LVTFLFSVHTITEAKQYAGLGRAEPGIEPGRWIFQSGHFDLARPGVAPPLRRPTSGQPSTQQSRGATGNTVVENAIRAKLQGWKMQEWKKQE